MRNPLWGGPRTVCAAALALLMLATGTAAQAQTIASSNFTTGPQGWTVGEFTGLSSTSPVTFNPTGTISTNDVYGYNAFVAPAAYLGNKSAAFGGTFNFSLADVVNDNILYAPFTLISGTVTLYAAPTVIPSTNPLALTPYSITLTGANFRFGDIGGGGTATDADLLAVLGSLDRIGINADWNTGSDGVTLDNVSLCGPAGCPVVNGAVPEPAAWALMILGFGVIGTALRRRRGVPALA